MLRTALRFLIVVPLFTSLFAQEISEEQRGIGFVRTIAEGEAGAVLAYIEKNFNAEVWQRRTRQEWKSLAQQLSSRHSGLEIVGVDIPEPHKLVVETLDTRKTALQFFFEFEDAPPFLIKALSLEAGRADRPSIDLPELVLDETKSQAEVAAALEIFFNSLAEADRFSGTALVAVRGKTIFQGAYGLATRSWNVPNTMDTRFDLGSINKTFTQVAIAQLLEQGKLGLKDRLIDHLPDYPNPEAARKITLGQLVDHSSGLGDIFTEKFFRASRALFRSPSDYFQVFADQPLLFEPGTDHRYSNAGYVVLGAVIEAVSGEPFDGYIQEHVFKPAGMDRAGFFSRDTPEPGVAVGYTRRGPQDGRQVLHNNLFMLPVKGSPAGSAFATAQDLLNFDEALREHRLLPPAHTRWVLGGPIPGEAGEVPSGRAEIGLGIAGGAPGVSAAMETDGFLQVIVLCNYDEPIAEAVARKLTRELSAVLKK